MPGVYGVFTAAHLDADGIGTLPCIARVATVAPMIVPPRRALAREGLGFASRANTPPRGTWKIRATVPVVDRFEKIWASFDAPETITLIT
jgi:hypothetical protein